MNGLSTLSGTLAYLNYNYQLVYSTLIEKSMDAKKNPSKKWISTENNTNSLSRFWIIQKNGPRSGANLLKSIVYQITLRYKERWYKTIATY